MTSYCGINCEECEAFIATQNKDNQLKTKVAQRWSSLYGKKIKPDDVYCYGCKFGGTQGIYCQAMCRIKPCCREKQIETCAQCKDFACKDLKEVFNFCSDAKKALMCLKE
jgi:hypothetical protein